MKRMDLSRVLVAVLMCLSGYAALFVAPDERTMHAAQRIFYFHLPSWIAMFTAFFIAVIGNIAYLTTRSPKWDWLGVASAEVGVTCCTIGLITGPLWAKPIWGIWWTWDPKLTTTFILWMLYISYLLLRTLVEEPERRATVSAVFGVFAFLDVPLVYLANRIWRTQHPAPVILGGPGSGLNPTMGKVLLLCVIAELGVMILLLLDRYRLERLRYELGEVRLKIESRNLDRRSGLLEGSAL